MATTIIKSGNSDNQAIVNDQGRLLVDTGGGSGGSNASVGSNGTTAPTYSTEIAGVNPEGVLTPITVSDAGYVNVNESGTVVTSYGDVSNVSSGALTTITSYVAAGPTRLKHVEVSGTNIATYSVTYNGTTLNKKQTFFGVLSNTFDFDKGYPLVTGDTVTVVVVHNRPFTGEFTGFMLLLKDY